ncbi:MAG: DUF1559 domain-containing protein [Planctomycetaceae bacterium]
MTDNPYDAKDAVADDAKPAFRIRWGWVLGLTGICAIAVLLLVPTFARNRVLAERVQCKNNLQHIAKALHSYHDEHGSFPPAYTTDASGKPLHSWRTLLLPHLEQKALYDSIDLTKPWDDAANALAFQTVVPVFQCRATDLPPEFTTYRAMVGDDAVFHSAQKRTLDDVTDGTENTLAVVEVLSENAVHWMNPDDKGVDAFRALAGTRETSHTGGVYGMFCDGSVRFISASISRDMQEAAITISGGEDNSNDF